MKILTPSASGVITPAGIINNYGMGLVAIATYDFSFPGIVADFATAPALFFTPTAGTYAFYGYQRVTASTASGGAFNLSIDQGATNIITSSGGIAGVGGGTIGTNEIFLASSGGDVEVYFTVTGFGTGSCDVSGSLTVYKVA